MAADVEPVLSKSHAESGSLGTVLRHAEVLSAVWLVDCMANTNAIRQKSRSDAKAPLVPSGEPFSIGTRSDLAS